MLNIYATTFRIATLTETPDVRPARGARTPRSGWTTRARRWLAAHV